VKHQITNILAAIAIALLLAAACLLDMPLIV
jgi:hypothetical protein